MVFLEMWYILENRTNLPLTVYSWLQIQFWEIYDHWPRSMDPYMLGKPGWMFGSRLVRMLEHDIGYRNHTGCEGWHASKILVGGLEHLLFFHRLGMSSSQLTKLYFSEGWLNHQPDGMWLTHFMTGSQEAGGPGMEHTVGKWVDVGYSVIELALIYWPVPVWQYWPYKPH